ncbi:MAG: hypothetical protein JNG88_08120 [Phycisphaerales bacterium]|nr:hypothetical protein [Phycisphaerales bacterium]
MFSAMRLFSVLTCAMSFACVAGCELFGPRGTVDSATQTLRDLADTVNLESEAWREQVAAATDKLTREGRQALAHDLDNVVQRGIAAAGAEFRCNVDFLRDRVHDEIEGLIAGLLGMTPPPNPPTVCKVVPEIVDLSQPPTQMTRVSLFGYDFRQRETNQPNLKLRGLKRSGQFVALNDWLALSNHYQGAISITQENGRKLRDLGIRELQVMYGDQVLSQISVNPYIPTVSSATGSAKTLTHFPPRSNPNADEEYWTGQQLGHYSVVRVNLKTEGRLRNNKVEARVWMQAWEWDRDRNVRSGDKTAAEGWSEWIELYTPPAGHRIRHVESDLEDNPAWFECEKTPVELNRAGSLVLRYRVIGDGDGADIKRNTCVDVKFNPVRVEIETVDPW